MFLQRSLIPKNEKYKKKKAPHLCGIVCRLRLSHRHSRIITLIITVKKKPVFSTATVLHGKYLKYALQLALIFYFLVPKKRRKWIFIHSVSVWATRMMGERIEKVGNVEEVIKRIDSSSEPLQKKKKKNSLLPIFFRSVLQQIIAKSQRSCFKIDEILGAPPPKKNPIHFLPNF